ncbi:MAG: hypothetical protein NT142_18720 [Planctomycetota bacterium]|nr:hypothetical protein [Planctomycetota bacterium]
MSSSRPVRAWWLAHVGPTDDGVRDSEDGGAKPADQSIDPRAVVSRPVECIVGADQDVAVQRGGDEPVHPPR